MDQVDMPSQKGEPAAEFERLLRECQARLFGYIHSLVRDLDDAEDLFQQTAIILWKKFSAFERQQSFLAWACGVARLEVSDFLRVRSRSHLYFTDELNLLLIPAQIEFGGEELESRQEALRGCVQKLGERDRQLLAACYGAAHGVAAAAQGSGRSTQSIQNSLRRIRRALFECVRRAVPRLLG